MSPPWIRRQPTREDTATALAAAATVAVGLGAVVFYLARAVLAREELADSEKKLLDAPRP